MVVERCLKLSVRAFVREGMLNTSRASGSWTWRGTSKSSVGFELDTSEDGSKKLHLEFTYRNQEQTIHETIWLQTTRPHYGGVRWWFTCPRCGKRVAFLYLPPGHHLFLCRGCHRLSYYSQRLGPHDRTLMNTMNMRQRLGGTKSLSEPFPFKPKGMHWNTYEKHRWKYTKLLGKLAEYMQSWH
jgi:hypothetical protein